ncbi:MAG: hypothetical protein JWR26_3135 [Pedosphaera sp.]|nr:hypothetical protein [Pedosphaera sp.]
MTQNNRRLTQSVAFTAQSQPALGGLLEKGMQTVSAPNLQAFTPAPGQPALPARSRTESRSPRVNVLIPTYNYARYLPETIESVLEQDFQDYEILIVDDCSTDESQAVIRHYAAMDSRIRYRFNPSNLGMVANWNYCLSQARGEYVQFLFGDDRLASRAALGKMVRMLEGHPSAVLGVAARNIIDERSRITEVASHLGASGLHDGHEVITRCLETNANIIGEPSVVMIRRSEGMRGFCDQYRQIPDLEMWFHLLEAGDAVYTSEPLYSFRKHPRQQTEVNRVDKVGEREHLLLLAEYYGRPWLKARQHRNLLFSQIYWLKKKGDGSRISRELESRMMRGLGKGRYAWLWSIHRATRPFSNLQRFYLKHILHRSVR